MKSNQAFDRLGYAPPRGLSDIPQFTRWLIISNVIIFVLQMLGWRAFLFSWFALFPLGVSTVPEYETGVVYLTGFRIWQLVSYAWLHGNFAHLFMNLFGLYMLGSIIERAWGAKRYSVFYLVCVVGAGLTQLLIGAEYPTVGASGGLFGILLAFGVMFPNQRLMLLFLPYPIKAKWFVLGYGVVEIFLGVTGVWQQGVAHFAHVGGMVTGYLLYLFWVGRLPIKPRPGKLW